MMSLRGWEKLACGANVTKSTLIDGGEKCPEYIEPCDSEDFVAVHKLTWHEGQGTASKQDAWKCAKCGAVASTSKMIDEIQKRHLRDKIKELEAQQ